MSHPRRPVIELETRRFKEAADVMVEAFYDYPAMHHFFEGAGADYARHLRAFIGFSTWARRLRGDPVLAVEQAGAVVAAAYLVRPEVPMPAALDPYRDELWRTAGARARRSYDAFSEATAAFSFPEPHLHLSLIGVRRQQAGRGYARLLMDAVWELSRSLPHSRGVSLTTEKQGNLSFYEYFGYECVGHARVGPVETWGFFRAHPDR